MPGSLRNRAFFAKSLDFIKCFLGKYFFDIYKEQHRCHSRRGEVRDRFGEINTVIFKENRKNKRQRYKQYDLSERRYEKRYFRLTERHKGRLDSHLQTEQQHAADKQRNFCAAKVNEFF